MKWKWFVIAIVIMTAITEKTEERGNPFVLINILFERGMMAWVELTVLTTMVVLPSYFITKGLERIMANVYPQATTLKSLFFAICSTVICYFIVMAILEPIKHA